MRRRLLIVLGWLLALGAGSDVFAAGSPPKCLGLYVEDLADLAAPERRQVLRAVKTYDDTAQEGVEFFLQYRELPDDGMERLHQALQNFRHQNTVPTPFANDRDLFAAIAEVDRANPGVENMGKVVGDLGQPNALGLSQAAAYDLHIAKQTGAGQVAGFRKPVTLNGVTREVDLLEGPPGIDPAVAIHHENKSFVVGFDPGDINFPVRDGNGRFVYADERLTTWAQEFDREIVMHLQTGFTKWRTNLRPQLAIQRSEIEQFLLKQFESSFVTSRLTADEIEALEDLFRQRVTTNLQFR
jgi:hypothetical protein